MRIRLFLILGLVGAALAASAAASAYPWPVKPFNRQHPIRANFGDPRTIFQIPLFQDGIEGPGSFLFHNGIDISAPDGTSVYPVLSGTVHLLGGESVAVETPERGRSFQYFHIVPIVAEGETVIAQRTVIGYIAKSWGHVHLTEIRDGKVWNPLAPRGIAPYRDRTKPTVADIVFREGGTIKELDPLAVCGRVAIAAQAYDTPPLKIPGVFANFPVAPATVSWTMRRVGSGEVVAPTTMVVDFSGNLPLDTEFWDLYARGTYQNAPRFGERQFGLMPGRFLYNLTPPAGVDSRTLPNGVYQVTVRATDMRGNTSSLNRRFTLTNQSTSATGCPPTSTTPPKKP